MPGRARGPRQRRRPLPARATARGGRGGARRRHRRRNPRRRPGEGTAARLRARFPAAGAVVFGHSHMPLHEAEKGFQIFNPGSPTERRRAPRPSMGLLELADGDLRFEHVWL
ncbi:MAG TPA: metallophosphoesterase family protein [Solirubrobacterales bacterium]|nr:metallophosphoesterase family protein [Solirubrobacterales bacterium]